MIPGGGAITGEAGTMKRKTGIEMRIKAIALTLITSLVISCAAVMPVRAEGGETGGSTPSQQTEVTNPADPSNPSGQTGDNTGGQTSEPTVTPAQPAKVSVPSSKTYGKQYKKKKKYKGPSKWAKTINTLEKRSKSNQGKVVFIGSSSIRKWSTLSKDMAPLEVVNLGFGGSTVNDSVYYADRLIVPAKPKAIVFYAGTNDIAYGYSPTVVYKRTIDFITYIHKALPGTPIYYIEQTRQPKRNKYWKKMKKLNSKVSKYAKSDPLVTYIPTRKALNTKKDKAQKKYFVKDKLHFNKKGYAKWTSVIKPVLHRDLLK